MFKRAVKVKAFQVKAAAATSLQEAVDEMSAGVTETVTWKLVSFQPGFLANILTKAWQGITVISMVSTA